jgi:hypothetical protein
MSRVLAKLLPRAGLVSLAEPSLFTPEHVAYITSRTDTAQHPNFMSTLAFGRHFAASVDTRMVLAVVDSHWVAHHVGNGYVAAYSEWEYREGILSLASIITHLLSSPSATPDERLSPRSAAKMLLEMITNGWSLSTDPTVHDSWKRLEGDQAVQAVKSLSSEGESDYTQ